MLVAGQLALALVVLSTATLVARSLRALETSHLGFDPQHVAVAGLTLRVGAYDSASQQVAMLDRLMPAIERLPGVTAASPVVAAPFAQAAWAGRIHSEGQTPSEVLGNPVLNLELVAPGYFRTLGMTVLRGRRFAATDRDGAQPVVMLSESAANHLWPHGDPIGKRVRMAGHPVRTFTVVGVVPDTRYRDLRAPAPSVYFPMAQSFFPYAPTFFLVRSNLSTAALSASLQRTVAQIAPGVTLSSVEPFSEYLEGPLAQPRFNAFLLTVFATTAVFLAAVGLLGIMSALVRKRVREFGIRQALGATSDEIRRMVMRRGLAIAALGVAVGAIGSLLAGRLLGSLLYAVSPTDPASLGAAAALLLVFAASATALPARTSSRIEPSVALRDD